MSELVEPAPAKLNLALHVRGRLPDGRHRVETIFAFCEAGDRLEAEPARHLSLSLSGPFGSELAADDDNLVLRAARALRTAARVEHGAALRLDKRLPVASGIGGGSADAAAALRLLTRLWDIDPDQATAIAPGLGADVPACLFGQTCRGSGSGEDIEPIAAPELAQTPALLVNPGIALATATVFERWDGIDRGPLGDWREGRNDLACAAIGLVPQIADVLDWLGRQPGAQRARMSGSGATCFAMFANLAERDRAAARCAADQPSWWHLATTLR